MWQAGSVKNRIVDPYADIPPRHQGRKLAAWPVQNDVFGTSALPEHCTACVTDGSDIMSNGNVSTKPRV